MGEVMYKFIRFDWPRKQCGVVVASPPNECIVTPRVVAVTNELDMENPSVILADLPITVGMLRGIGDAVSNVALVDRWFYMNEWYKSFVTFVYLDATAELTRLYDDEVLYTSSCIAQLGRQDDMRYAAVHYDCIVVTDNFIEHMENELWSYR